MHRSALLLGTFLWALVCSFPASADDVSLKQFLANLQPSEILAGADSIDAPQGSPPIALVRKGGQKAGYVYLNTDIVTNVGYSGKPIHMLIGMDMQGVITGIKLVKHHEPIVLIGIPEHKIVSVLDNYIGLNVVEYASQKSAKRKLDIVSGATVTIMVMDDSILNSAIAVARHLRIAGLEPESESETGVSASIDMSLEGTADWFTLVQDGSVKRLPLSVGTVNQAFKDVGDPVAIERPEQGDPDDSFMEMYTALVSVPSIGRSLLGDAEYKNLKSRLSEKQNAILLLGNGRYSFKGSGYVRGGIFDRFQLIQHHRSIRFKDINHKRLRALKAQGAPDFKEIGVFKIPQGLEFNPTEPWRIELLVSRSTGPTSKAFTTFDLPYQVPERYLKKPAPTAIIAPPDKVRNVFDFGSGELPLWTKLWQQKTPFIGLLLIAIVLLTLVFFFQNWLVKYPRLTDYTRLGFLCFTFLGLGWYANAQLSVVNILTVFNALVSGFNWEYFLMEPLIFILWGSVAAALLFWGRGPFCGWLCPFGAMQELLNRVAKLLKTPQVLVPWWLHERLWAVKYIIFLALFGISLHSLEWAERLAEIEPFKTAIILKFDRSWPYVAFALAMLAPGLFIERFYCRYLCPLGAALAIPGKLRMFEWLKRYKECGTPCQRCANECMVQAIHKEGNINPNECLYCLHCQVVYFDDHACPVVIQQRMRNEGQRIPGRERKAHLEQLIEEITVAKPHS